MKNIKDSRQHEIQNLLPRFDQRRMDLGLTRINKALDSMGNPSSQIPAIQIAGTNGKGSIACFIQSCLQVAGISSGTTTSPHLTSWCERINTNGSTIKPGELIKRLKKIKPISEKFFLTPFEILIAVAFDYFASKHVELLILEVGLGGRLDATTAHPKRPIIALASIDLDHCEHLGKTIEKIAYEKASIITPGSTVISAKQHPIVSKIIEDFAENKQAKLQWVQPLNKDWELGIAGDIQRKNAAVAKGALEALTPLGWAINQTQIETGFSLAKWPGRLQTLTWKGMPLLVDGAHNPSAAKQLSAERKSWEFQENGVNWIIGMQSHKEGPSIIRHLIKSPDICWIVPIPNHLSWKQQQLSDHCPELSAQLKQANSVQQALDKILSKKWPTPNPVLTGSLYLIGSLLESKLLK